MFYHFKSTQLFIFAQKCRHSCSKTSFGVRPMLDCRNATSVDNNKSICMSEIRIACAQFRKVFNKKVQPYCNEN